jgi:hypothetical protein
MIDTKTPAPIDCDNCPTGSDCTECVDVVFLRDFLDGDVFAVFPGLAASGDDSDLMTCYVHVGQHGSASLAYCNGCDEVTDRAEYADLAAELESIGYVLYVLSKARMSDDCYAAARTKSNWRCCNG